MFRSILAMVAFTGSALISLNASAACADGQRHYDPTADKNESRWEICVDGRWQKEGAPAYVSEPSSSACVDGSSFYDPAAQKRDPKWYVCKGGKFYALTVDGKIKGRKNPKIYTCKEGSTFYDASAEKREPRFYVCRNGKFVVGHN